MSFWDRVARSHHQSSDSEEDFLRPLRRQSQSGTSRFCPEKFTVYVVLACLFYGASLPVLGQSEKKPWCNLVLLRSLISVWSYCFHLFTSSFVPFRIKGNPALFHILIPGGLSKSRIVSSLVCLKVPSTLTLSESGLTRHIPVKNLS